MPDYLIDKKFLIAGKECHLILKEPMGAGGGYHVMLNNFYQGCVVTCSEAGWRAHISDSVLTEPIINRILEIVKERHSVKNDT